MINKNREDRDPRWQPQECSSWDPVSHHPAHGHPPHPAYSRHDRPLHSDGQLGAAATLAKLVPPGDVVGPNGSKVPNPP